jgi:predicted outer membrane protein
MHSLNLTSIQISEIYLLDVLLVFFLYSFWTARSTAKVSAGTSREIVDPAPVMEFAQQMVDDHSKAGDEMKTAATAAGVTLPADMTATDKAKITDLNGATDFQTAYVDAQVKAHDDAVALFQSFAENGPDGPLKDFATKTLPTLQQHQSAIHAIAGK